MQIIGGRFKRKKLLYPDPSVCRPTQNKVRESIFNIIQTKIEEAIVLDLCCGTGALGFEAYSRGAKTIYLVDKNIVMARKNKVLLQLDQNPDIKCIKKDVVSFLKKGQIKADLIFLDPPWKAHDLYENALKAIFDFDILNAQGVLVCEHEKKNMSISWPNPEKVRQYHYASTVLSIYNNDD